MLVIGSMRISLSAGDYPNRTINGSRRQLGDYCDSTASSNSDYSKYFKALRDIYADVAIEQTCVPAYMQCGWPVVKSDLPLLVFAVGGEGSGHHVWQTLLTNVLDCVWQASDHYTNIRQGNKIVLTGFPHLEPETLFQSLAAEYKKRKNSNNKPCRQVFDAIDSFPYGLVKFGGRAMNHPDLRNIQSLDGVLFNIKYLILVRNLTDSAVSALGRRFVQNIDEAVRTSEQNMVYMEAAMRGVPCHKTFVVHFEHLRSDPASLVDPLSAFLQLESSVSRDVLRRNLQDSAKKSSSHRKRQYRFPGMTVCKSLTDAGCYRMVWNIINNFFMKRKVMWPTFAGNGYNAA